MKQIVIPFLFLIALNLKTNAQVSFGPRLGLNLNPEPNNNTYGYRYLNSFNGGLMGRYRVNNWLSVKTEINYNTKKKTYQYQTKESLLQKFSKTLGTAINLDTLGALQQFLNDTVYSFYKGSDALRFIELPLMATANYKQFEFSGGFYFGYLAQIANKEELTQTSPLLDIILPAIDSIQFVGPLVSGIITSAYPGYKTPYNTESTNKAPYRKTDYGLIMEVTYHTTDKVFFSFRYARGFQNYRINALRSKDVFNTFTLSLGYTFGNSFTSKPKGIYDLEKIPVENQ